MRGGPSKGHGARHPGWTRFWRDEAGQSVLEAAALMVPFIVAFLVCIQLAIVVVYRWQMNHLAFQAARQHSVRSLADPGGFINDPITGVPTYTTGPATAMNWTALAYYLGRETPEAAFIAMTSDLSSCPEAGSSGEEPPPGCQVEDGRSKMVYTGRIPLMVPGAAQLMAPEDTSLEANEDFTSFVSSLANYDAGAVGDAFKQHFIDILQSLPRLVGVPTAWETPNNWNGWKKQLLNAALIGKLDPLRDFDALKGQLLFQRFLEVRIVIPMAPEPNLMPHDFFYCGETTEPPCADNDRL